MGVGLGVRVEGALVGDQPSVTAVPGTTEVTGELPAVDDQP